MASLYKRFEHHFADQQRGGEPYRRGFIVVGKLPGNGVRETIKPSKANEALASISPAIAAADRAAELVGANGKPRTKRRKPAKRGGKKTPSKKRKKQHRRMTKKGGKRKKKSTRPNKEKI